MSKGLAAIAVLNLYACGSFTRRGRGGLEQGHAAFRLFLFLSWSTLLQMLDTTANLPL